VTGHSAEYKRYLKSPEWAERKRRYYRIRHRRCAACGTWKKVHLHHARYDRLTRELDGDLWPLCFACHRNVHAAARSGKHKDLEAATVAIVDAGQARRWRREQFRRLGRWITFPGDSSYFPAFWIVILGGICLRTVGPSLWRLAAES
jgi:hypothetical protein